MRKKSVRIKRSFDSNTFYLKQEIHKVNLNIGFTLTYQFYHH